MTDKGFILEISSRYDGFWRYNVALMCGCFDTADIRTGFVSTESHVADVGANLAQRPDGIPASRSVTLDTPPCDHLTLYLYLVPHTLPSGRGIDDAQPFEIELTVSYAGERLRTEKYAINQWSGASIEMHISK